MSDGKGHDPGDAVPPGVAVKYPAPLSEHDRDVKRKLEELGAGHPPPERGQPQGQAETIGPENRDGEAD
ncbi:hypothetical protein [Roseomonas sp. BN140053]|uniref:hypothetical protein n=1 Tax=Roseomonas sp. BN140053 TaxID=3391898 RepID=UPI0039EAD2CB